MRIEPSVWCSNFFYDLEAVKYLDYDYPSPPPKDLWVFGYRNGHHIDPTLLPNQLHMEKTNVELPDIFKATGRVAVARGGLKELLDDFSLGASYFHPVHIFYPRSDREYQGRFYILNIAELRARSLPEHSQRVRLHPNGKRTVEMANSMALDIAVRAGEPEDVDLWMDPQISEVIFLSARLAAGLRAAKIERFQMFPCREIV